jgi:hypothetical protein
MFAKGSLMQYELDFIKRDLGFTVSIIQDDTKIPANAYQLEAAIMAMNHYSKGYKTIYYYKKSGRVFRLVQNVMIPGIINYTMINEDDTFDFVEICFDEVNYINTIPDTLSDTLNYL